MFVKSKGPIVFSDSSDDNNESADEDIEMDALVNEEDQSEDSQDRKRLKIS